MAVLVHHHQPGRRDGEQAWAWTVLKALLTLLLVTAVVAAAAGVVAYAVAQVLVALMA